MSAEMSGFIGEWVGKDEKDLNICIFELLHTWLKKNCTWELGDHYLKCLGFVNPGLCQC